MSTFCQNTARVLLAGCIGGLLGVGHAEAVEIGDILVADADARAVFVVDQATGDRTILSSSSVGSGPSLGYLGGITTDASGAVLVSDRSNGIVRIDPTNGNRTVISGGSIGAGPTFGALTVLSVASNGDIYSGQSGTNGGLFRVDPITGDRTIVSSDSIGSGPSFGFLAPVGLALTGSSAIITDTSNDRVVGVDLATGNRTTLSGSGVGPGPAFGNVRGMAMDASGNLIVADNRIGRTLGLFQSGGLVSVDPLTGERTVLTTLELADGPFVRFPEFMAISPDGTYIFDGINAPPGSASDSVLLSFDPSDGSHRIITSQGLAAGSAVGTGPAFQNITGMAVMTVPAPSAGVVCALGLVSLTRRRRAV